MVIRVSLLLLAVSACGRAPVPCGPATCAGCCDEAGSCQSGREATACGLSGAQCTSCGANLCVVGACFAGHSSTGGGDSAGGASGGASAGGGVGGGVTGGGAGGGFAGMAGGMSSGGGQGASGGGLVSLPDAGSALSFRVFMNAVGPHSCALYDSGEVWCWSSGPNDWGQVGEGADAGIAAGMRRVPNTPADLVSLAPGGNHTCGLTASGTIWCWGANDHGQLGMPPAVALGSRVPVQVLGVPPAASLSSGFGHACAGLASGGVWCWGSDEKGQVSGAPGADQPAPRAVVGVQGLAAQVVLGPTRSCAVVGGAVVCWGSDDASPAAVTDLGLSGIRSLALGSQHACASDVAGAVRCWGSNGAGQLGTRDVVTSQVPRLSVVGDAVSVAVGLSSSCALKSSGEVHCWGSAGFGVQGNGTANNAPPRLTPGPVSVVTNGQRLGSSYFANAVTTGDALFMWGSSSLYVDHLVPARLSMTPLRGGRSQTLRLGAVTHCALLESRAWCWGSNDHGQAGVGRVSDPAVDGRVGLSLVVGLPSGLIDVAVGSEHACAVGALGEVWCWGRNFAGQLGVAGGDASTPVRVAQAPADARRVFAGGDSTCVVTASNEAWCWGARLATAGSTSTAAVVSFGAPVADLALGAGHGCARSVAGALSCWGTLLGSSGQIRPVTLPAPVSAVHVRGISACATVSNGSVWCWGSNWHGLLGDGTSTSNTTPRQVSGLTNATQVVLGSGHGCALTAGGTVWCWGERQQVGRGQRGTEAELPAEVPGLRDIVRLEAGSYTTVALRRDGAVLCFGSGLFGGGGALEPLRCAF